MKKPQSKKTIIIIIAAVCVLAGAAAGFLLGRNTRAKSEQPYITVADFRYNDAIVQEYASSGTADAAYMKERFEMPQEKAESLLQNPADWLSYSFYINIVNPGRKDYNFFRAECGNNGKNDIFIDIASTASYGIPGGGENQICLTVFAYDDGRSDEEIEAQVRSMDIGFLYSTADDMADTHARFQVAPMKDTEK